MKKIFYLVIPILLFAIDRLIKLISPHIKIGAGFVKIELYKNYAGAFSLPIAGTVYNIVGIVFISLFFYFFIFSFKKDSRLQSIAYLSIVLGGASNLFDRLYFGYVIDYVQIINRSFFNIADAMLIGGVGILIAGQLKKKNSKLQITNSKQIPKN